MDKWLGMTAADLGRGIARGDIDPVDLVQVHLDAIGGHDLSDRIYARTTPQRAMAEANAARARIQSGRRLSPLDGVPISWKDLFDSAGVATEAGSALLRDRVPERDAAVLRTATALGSVCLGKTHMSELAFSGLGLNPVTATSPCVNDVGAVSGGSSSGAAASVAFGLAAGAIGSDTGGSVRIPAAWNDLVGLKTTSGRVTLEGVVPLCLRFDTVGPLARSVEDAALMLALVEGRAATDLRGASLRGRRLAVLRTIALDGVREAPARGFENAVKALRDEGAEIVEIEIPELVDAFALTEVLYCGEAYGLWRDVIEANPELMYHEILERFRAGNGHSAPDYVAAWASLEHIRGIWHAATAGFDAVLCATSPILPPDAERLQNDSEYYVTENLLALRNTRVGNLMGLCAVTVPTGVASCGITLMGAPGSEEALLRLSAAAQDAIGV